MADLFSYFVKNSKNLVSDPSMIISLPVVLEVIPPPISFLSTKIIFNPLLMSLYALLIPVIPPPTIKTSHFLLLLNLSKLFF